MSIRELQIEKIDKIKVCHCPQCMDSRRKKSSKIKRFYKRYTNKLRRKDKQFSMTWA